MLASKTTPSVSSAADVFARRSRRAAKLRERLPFAAEPLLLCERLLAVQAPAHARALVDRPPLATIAKHVARHVAPAIAGAVAAAGPAMLAAAAMPWLHDRAEADVERWLAGGELAPIDCFFARASSAPVLEALAACGALAGVAADARHCPRCGGLPQVAYTVGSGDALVTPPMRLCCARCGDSWQAARLRCVACGEADAARLCSFEADEQLPHLRIDACSSCHSYLVHVDLRRDAEAVPEVDELTALPLDLHAQQQGFRKIVGNLMGIG